MDCEQLLKLFKTSDEDEQIDIGHADLDLEGLFTFSNLIFLFDIYPLKMKLSTTISLELVLCVTEYI